MEDAVEEAPPSGDSNGSTSYLRVACNYTVFISTLTLWIKVEIYSSSSFC